MRTISEFLQIKNIVIAFFFEGGTLYKSLPLASDLSARVSNWFAADPVLTGIDIQGPDFDSVPRIIFNNTEEPRNITITGQRADINFSIQSDSWNGDVSALARELLTALHSQHVKVVRFGVVATYKISEELSQEYFPFVLQKYFVKASDGIEEKEIVCGWRKTITVCGTEMNRWVRINATNELGNGINQANIDSNTFAGNQKALSIDEIVSITQGCLTAYGGGELNAIFDR